MDQGTAVQGVSAPAGNTEPQPLLTLSGVGKRFGEFSALADIDISFKSHEAHCLLGENGAGKSTLCNLVFGIHQPTSGAMQLEGASYAPANPRDAMRHGVAMVHQHFSLINELPVIDNLLIGKKFGRLNRKAEAEKLMALATEFGLELAPFDVVGDLSVGQRQRVEIVKCLMQRPRLLILDEPTAVLLPEEINSLLDVCSRVAESGCAVVMVTHKLAEIARVADRVTVLRGGRAVARSAEPSNDMDMLVRAMISRDGEAGANHNFGVSALPPRDPTPHRGPRPEAMQIDNLSFVDEIGVKRLDSVTLTIAEGEIVGIAGVEGNGQSELGSILAGLARATSGRWFAAGREMTAAKPRQITAAGVGVIPEDRHLVASIGQLSLADNLQLGRMQGFARYGLIDRKRQREEARTLMQRFDVRAPDSQSAFSTLSGGNQQKAVLARELTTPNLRFLLAAHPTRGLDIGAIEAVYTFIRQAADQNTGVLLISSELDELLAVADRIVVFYRGRIIGERSAKSDNRDDIGSLMSGKTP